MESRSDKLERELILKQLLYLRQDVNELKKILIKDVNQEDIKPAQPALFLPSHDDDSSFLENKKYNNINDASISGLKEDSIGEMTMNEYEKEIIERSLIKFKNNRRKTAKALNISERTLYRKLKEYGI